LVRERNRLRLLRFPPGAAGAPREAWSAELPGQVSEAAAAARIDRKGRRHAAAVSAVERGVVLLKLFADPDASGSIAQVRAGEALPLPGSRIALDPAEDGSCRAAVVYQRLAKRPGGRPEPVLTLLEASFGPDGAPRGAPELTDVAQFGDLPPLAAACCFHAGRAVFAALLADGTLVHNAGGSGAMKLTLQPITPLQLLSFDRDTHLLVLPGQGAPQFIPLR
jgi:hypothetical protein